MMEMGAVAGRTNCPRRRNGILAERPPPYNPRVSYPDAQPPRAATPTPLGYLSMSKTATNSPGSSAEPRKNRILIADDNGPNVELLEAYLSGVDCEIAVAVDGRDTLDKVAEFKPDIILLDVMMPKLSGFEVCQRLKGDKATSGIMILMVTALNELGDIERAVQAGTDDFLSKPVNKLELVKRVENMLKLRHVTDEVERLRQYIAQMEDQGEEGGTRHEEE
jgi:CheY-like chemotaxis protein